MQWLLDLMGQIRLFLRSAEPISADEVSKLADSNTAGGFHLLFDALAVGAICLAETDPLLLADEGFSSSTGWRQRLDAAFPLSVGHLAQSDPRLGTQMGEWAALVLADKSGHVSSDHRRVIRTGLSAFKTADNYTEAWGKLVMLNCSDS